MLREREIDLPGTPPDVEIWLRLEQGTPTQKHQVKSDNLISEIKPVAKD